MIQLDGRADFRFPIADLEIGGVVRYTPPFQLRATNLQSTNTRVAAANRQSKIGNRQFFHDPTRRSSINPAANRRRGQP
jgi:hypothetical protein